MIELVVLPGLDGTASMLADFKSAAMASFESVTVVSYPADRPLDYAELECIARKALPKDRPFVLLGESFSGPIAISIAANPPANLHGLVLSATFAKNPVLALKPFSALARFAPVRLLPVPVLSWFLLGSWTSPRLKTLLRDALGLVAPAVLRKRAEASLRVDVTNKLSRIAVPVLYLRANQDRLIFSGAGNYILSSIPQAKHIDITGPHLLLQVAPVACAQAVADFATSIASKS